ncbi:MAG: potassium channel protein [Anaerolineales bacterium]
MQWREFRAGLRDTWLLLREFAAPLGWFALTISGGGLAYFLLAQQAAEPISSLPEAMYHVLGLVIFQPIADFPNAWYLQVFYFAMPLIGIAIFAQGIAEFGVLLFNRRARGQEWEMAIASTFNNHVILVGLGHLGFRVADYLNRMEQDVVVIEMQPTADLVRVVRTKGIPVIEDDARRPTALEAAGIRKARAIMVCIQDDSANLQISVKARSLNPKIDVIVRIFDEDFAEALHQQFGFKALSATSMAAPAFAAAAAGVEMTRPIIVQGQAMSLATLTVSERSFLVNQSIEWVERRYEVSVVMLNQPEGRSDPHPAPDIILLNGDEVVVLGDPSEIARLSQENILGRAVE